jgi:hypothetical protein
MYRPDGLKALFCGGREWTDREAIILWLKHIKSLGFTSIIEGEARGADTIAREEADKLGLYVYRVPADWKRFGRAAGRQRNYAMLNMQPDLVVAFHENINNSAGTRHMAKISKEKGVPVIYIKKHGEHEIL